MGDDTWEALFGGVSESYSALGQPTAHRASTSMFHQSFPYPVCTCVCDGARVLMASRTRSRSMSKICTRSTTAALSTCCQPFDVRCFAHARCRVDDGIASNWSVVIAHFLGVDHVGHRFGPDHESMRTKMRQLDEVVRSVRTYVFSLLVLLFAIVDTHRMCQVVDEIDNSTLLLVFGDHGMTSRGDHGGRHRRRGDWRRCSPTPSRPLFARSDGRLRRVAQIDLVPTLALLLDVPIPFGNLGATVDRTRYVTMCDECRPSHRRVLGGVDSAELDGDNATTTARAETLAALARAVALNAAQTSRFLAQYAALANGITVRVRLCGAFG